MARIPSAMMFGMLVVATLAVAEETCASNDAGCNVGDEYKDGTVNSMLQRATIAREVEAGSQVGKHATGNRAVDVTKDTSASGDPAAAKILGAIEDVIKKINQEEAGALEAIKKINQQDAFPDDAEQFSDIDGDGLGEEKDLKELTLLAGAADDNVELTKDALEALGWEMMVKISDTTLAAYGMQDDAVTFRKGKHCIAAFAATNDNMDMKQVMEGMDAPTESMCGFDGVHKGFKEELEGFQRAEQWDKFVESLAGDDCEKRTAIGHSLGGAIATLFAACANAGAKSFGSKEDFALVVFSPPGVSKTPLYSGKPGTAFKGTRYSITESDGSAKKLPADTKQFRLDLLGLYSQMLPALGQDASALTQAKQAIESGAAPAEAVWAQVGPKLAPLGVPTFAVAMGLGPPGTEPLRGLIIKTVTKIAGRGELFYAFDPASALLTAGHGFKHALVDFQPLPHPAKSEGSTMAKVGASEETSTLPDSDFFQVVFSTLANSGGFPNHQICCYHGGAECASSYKEGAGREWKGCQLTPFR